MPGRKNTTLAEELELELDGFIDGLVAACRAMEADGWSSREVDEICVGAVVTKMRELMTAFRDNHIAALRREGELSEASLDQVRRAADQIIERDAAEIEARMANPRRGTVH
jgi:hypothetical protein